ncbi:hypothetical protein VP01_4714g1 [Puccinia sorghi]|uniref:Retrovirus-related Pol polyprotein from transposon TNT 1-94-like beta-barrel domain-containing protein n=1 Tax=Puccinia sorghi TaxID=27349 RepID=A0A0L6UPZ3_9BASI|nr:hypothetical protein VP01_4714g1 [Puccinia sorghi]
MDPAKFQKFPDWPQPMKFIKNYLKTIVNLTSLLQKDTPFIFTEQASKEFDALKKAFTTAPILAHFIAGIISKYSSSNLLHPRWCSYLLSLSEPFEFLTDHNALKYFMSSKVITHPLGSPILEVEKPDNWFRIEWSQTRIKPATGVTYHPVKVLWTLDNPRIPLGKSIDAELPTIVNWHRISGFPSRNNLLPHNLQIGQGCLTISSKLISIKKLVDVGIELPQDILAHLVLFKFPASLQNLKRQIMHSDKELNVEFICNHLAVLFSNKTNPNKSQGSEKKYGQSNSSKQCKSAYHNPHQDNNQSSNNYWHLHSEKAAEWWRDSQVQWKAGKEKEKENYFMSLLTLFIEPGNPNQRIILDSGALAHIFNDTQFFESLELGNLVVIKTGKQGATLPSKRKGTVRLVWDNLTISLSNCLYMPDIVINLISAVCCR